MLLAAFSLLPLDEACTQRGWCYVRYMDDIAIVVPAGHTLRAVDKVVNEVLAVGAREQEITPPSASGSRSGLSCFLFCQLGNMFRFILLNQHAHDLH